MVEGRRDKPVNGRVYSIILPPPTAALPLCTRTTVLLGGFVGLFADARSLVQESASQEEKLGKMLDKVGSALKLADPVAVNQLMMDAAYAANLTVDGKTTLANSVAFDQHFKDNRRDIYPVLLWCLWECVVDFFPELTNFAHLAKKVMTEEGSQSPTDGQKTTG